LHGPTWSRLLTLHPGPPGSPIEASLGLFNASKRAHGIWPDYSSISYAWGTAGNERSITVNGHQLSVRLNLWTILQKLRPEKGTREVWVDAICISQDDKDEKSTQVERLGEIFVHGLNVIAWLGEHSDGSETLLDGSTKIGIERFLAWDAFFKRQFWQRLWIAQKLILATEVIFLCGDSYWDFYDLRSAWLKIRSGLDELSKYYPELSRSLQEHSSSFDTVARYRDWRFGNLGKRVGLKLLSPFMNKALALEHVTRSLPELAEHFGMLQCEDPRDRLYAMLALADHKSKRLRPDYTVDMAQVFLRACRSTSRGRMAEDAVYAIRFIKALDLELMLRVQAAAHLLCGTTAEWQKDLKNAIFIAILRYEFYGPFKMGDTWKNLPKTFQPEPVHWWRKVMAARVSRDFDLLQYAETQMIKNQQSNGFPLIPLNTLQDWKAQILANDTKQRVRNPEASGILQGEIARGKCQKNVAHIVDFLEFQASVSRPGQKSQVLESLTDVDVDLETRKAKEQEALQVLREEMFANSKNIERLELDKPFLPGQQGGVYVHFTTEEDAEHCVYYWEGRPSTDGSRLLRAQFGTTRYCSAFLRDGVCVNNTCSLLHQNEEDS
jgi:hypothetical protein